MVMLIAGAAIPTFFLGIVLILIFAARLDWLPSGGYVPFEESPQEHFKSMILLASSPRLLGCRIVGAAGAVDTADAMRRDDYICTAMAKAGSNSAKWSPGMRCATRSSSR
ncbi:MAG: hypothetical protein R2848_00390 [Thermomicrobiales bacterium]